MQLIHTLFLNAEPLSPAEICVSGEELILDFV